MKGDLISRQFMYSLGATCLAKRNDDGELVAITGIRYLPSARPEPCDLCSNLEEGDTLYQSSDWDGGIGFDYIRDIQFCPKCGRRLEHE